MNRLDSIRAQIDAEDAAIIAAVQRRNYWVKRAQENNPHFDVSRESEIYVRYGIALLGGMDVARAVMRAGREAVRAAKQEATQ